MAFDRDIYMQEYRRVYMPAYREQNLQKLHKYDNDRYMSAKDAAFSALGGRCRLCGEDETEFLTIDHVNGGGCKDRRGRREIYLAVVRDLSFGEFRLLCRNCNSGLSVSVLKARAPYSRHSFSGPACLTCGRPKLVRTSSHPKYGTRKRTECRFCQKQKDHELRLQAIEILGGRCACCSEDDLVKLTVDHIQNDGNLRRERDHVGTSYFHRKVVSGFIDLSSYQVLCWNCNFSKHLGDGICVHQRKEVKE